MTTGDKKGATSSQRTGRWPKQRAQQATAHEHEDVVKTPAEEFHRLESDRSGQLLVDLLRDSPLRDVPIEPAGIRSPVRDVDL